MTQTPLQHPDHARFHGVPTPARTALAAAALRVADGTKWTALRSYPIFRAVSTAPIPRWVEPLGARGALRAALHTYRHVPAYRAFVDASGWQDDVSLSGAERLARLPIMDKRNYISAYPTAARCLGGRIPLVGTEMDESSGSSGTPYNWVRGAMELREVHRQLAMFSRYIFREEVVTINAFSMGAWSTGINTAQALRRRGLVKSPGPDLERIIATMRFLGPGYVYVLTGYPPFLREVLEYGDTIGFDWRPYRMFGIVGGEGMSEQLRDRLLTRMIAVYSAYGASDLDIGVAAETPLTIWLRRAAAADDGLRRALFGPDPRLPMVFQFNPLDYNVEVVDGELVITVSRLSMLSPRIRYNIHDAGGAHSLTTVQEICREFGRDPLREAPQVSGAQFRLPLMFIHGRSDATISYMGANIYPEDVEQALFEDTGVAAGIGAFCLELREVGDGAVRPCVHVEWTGGEQAEASVEDVLRTRVVDRLLRNSRDFKAAVAENPSAAEIIVQLHQPGEGPFAENTKRIKRRYIVPSA